MFAPADPEPLDATTYLRWEAEQERRHEFIDGEIVAMTGGTIGHNDLAVNLLFAIRPHLRSRGCRVNIADVKVCVRATGNYFYPDVMVSCDPRDAAAKDAIEFPCLIAEVLSPSTESRDRGLKLRNYRQLPSLQHYLVLDSNWVAIEHYQRQGDLWIYRSYGPGDRLTLNDLDLTIAVGDLYDGIGFPADEA